MIVIAERINATRKRIAQALEARDAGRIAREARVQAEAGADFIDVNAASNPARELDDLLWAVGVVQEATDKPLCLDSASPKALRAALNAVQRRPVILNSVTAEKAKMESVLPLAAEFGAGLVALTMDESGLPSTADQRVEIAGRLLEAANAAGVGPKQLYIDPCIQPLSTSPDQAPACLEAVTRIMADYPGVHTTCGLSNISFGLPERGLVNRTYLACLLMAGLDSAIIDPTAEGMMDTAAAADALAGRDEYCMNYIRRMR
jgi:5-methyltetrahydrofolate corrinoid/iron sulfur protein methyltransferase